MRGFSLVVASGGHSSSRCAGLSLSRPLLLRSTGSRRAGSVIVAHGPSCSAACGIFPDQGLNPCALHWQADSQSLRHQGSPPKFFFNNKHLKPSYSKEMPCNFALDQALGKLLKMHICKYKIWKDTHTHTHTGMQNFSSTGFPWQPIHKHLPTHL